jgi:nuclease S1
MLPSTFMRPILFLSLAAIGLPAFAWGPEGHSLVARIAEAQLTPAVRARVLEILGPGKTMPSVASWADEVRRARAETGPWHYVDIPNDKKHLDMERDCAKGDCVISALSRLRQTLRDPASTPDQRREALMFIIHFVGDMHQPLHSSDNKDRGGNSVQLTFHDRKTNLHSLWDSGLLGRLEPEDQLFPALSAESAKRRKKFGHGTVTAWAEESHKEGVKTVYGKLPKPVNATTPIDIPPAYETAADPLLRLQLERAGARLAYVLNTDLK